jgi:iron complex outermembrane receptor protein
MKSTTRRCGALLLAWSSVALLAQEQPAPSAEPAPAQSAAKPESEATTLKPVEVRANVETDGRRQATAAKIIFGREEIERYGDSTLGELFKRLPGVTTSGRPGQGGAPRMRGLGSGYTQILIDGERAPRGFSTDDITPDQVERIEILRAPTAETGARAIAGTINIVTRGGYTKYVNNATLGAGVEDGRTSPGASWSRNDTVDGLAYNVSVSVAHSERSNGQSKDTQSENLATSAVVNQSEATRSSSQRDVLHANARLQWNGAGGDTFTLMPMVVATQGTGQSASVLTLSDGLQSYNSSVGSSDGSFSLLRLGGSWTRKTDSGARLLLNSGVGRSVWHNAAVKRYVGGTGLSPTATDSDQQDTTWSNTLKVSQSIADKHKLVSGLELEGNQRNEVASTLRNGESALTDFDGNLLASSQRAAVYAQDEWEINPHWAAHAGLRWEGIRTSGSASAGGDEVSNHSQVLTPLLHTVWRPNLAVKDQWRASLTRSYRSPSLSNLIARPTINSTYPTGSNTELQHDSAGNPNLLPELAVGLDLAFEHYLPSGGLLSANVFVRQISNVIRSQTALETVSWSNVPRWVSRPQNVGSATSQGLELEAKLRLTEWWAQALPVDVRANLSLMRSSLDGVSSPNNRLDQQPDGTANLGADYRLKSWPLQLSANLNFTPSYTTRLSDTQQVFQSDKLVGDASVIWIWSPRAQLRLSASNFSARNYLTGGNLLTTNSSGQALRETTQTTAPTFTNLQAKLELKL